ncbi:MAG: RDD family protein [Chloroflexi bacterium]|nr:RDD family protein [Chloroflexota bacterium]
MGLRSQRKEAAVRCHNCAFENVEQAIFCNRCGSELQLRCPTCGDANQLGSAFCKQCGRKLLEAPQASPGPSEALPATTPGQVSLCERCGTENDQASLFCYKCGWRLEHRKVQAVAQGEPAGFWIRLGAYLIDDVLLLALVVVLVAVFFGANVAAQSAGASTLASNLIGALLSILYFTLTIGSWGATLGKRMLGLKVVRTDGSPVSYLRSLLRFLCYNLSLLPVGLGFVWIAWDEQKRGWHDYICDTKVIRARQ